MIHIVCCSDRNYIMPTGIMMKSVSMNNYETEIVFHVIVDEEVSEEQKELLEKNISDVPGHVIAFHTIDSSSMESFPKLGEVALHVTKATYYRLYMAAILPESIDKVVYLDGDIICRHSLVNLWECDMGEFAVSCVKDVCNNDIRKYNQLRYPSENGYFNAGVLLINLRYWREHHCSEHFAELIKNEPDRILFHDQDVLNICFQKSKIDLPLRYNLQNGFLYTKPHLLIDYQKYGEELERAIIDPVFIHYTATPKPWTEKCFHPFKSEFLYYKTHSLWANVPLQKDKKTMKEDMRNLLVNLHLLTPNAKWKEPFRTDIALKNNRNE